MSLSKTRSAGEKEVFQDFLDEEAMELIKSVVEDHPGKNIHIVPKEAARKVLTPERMRMIEALREEEFASIRELARELKRDVKNVSDDLEILWNHSIVDFEEEGQSKKPRIKPDRIIVEPL